MDEKELVAIIIKQQEIINSLLRQTDDTTKDKKFSAWHEATSSLKGMIKAANHMAQDAERKASIHIAASACEMADELGVEYKDSIDAIEKVDALIERLRGY